MTLIAGLTADADLMEAAGALKVPVPIGVLRLLIKIAEKEAKK